MKLVDRISLAICALLLVSLFCGSCNREKKRVVSDVPIKTEIMGMKLGEVIDKDSIVPVVSAAAQQSFSSVITAKDAYYKVRCFSDDVVLHYGGFSWHDVEVSLHSNNKVAMILFSFSFESRDHAKKRFDKLKQSLTNKYGQGNERGDGDAMFWTDDTNSVGVRYEEGTSVYGEVRFFCKLYYANIALVEDIKAHLETDI